VGAEKNGDGLGRENGTSRPSLSDKKREISSREMTLLGRKG